MKDSVMMIRDRKQKLTVRQLAEALYEGTQHLQNLAENLARQHGQGCQALTFFGMMGRTLKTFGWVLPSKLLTMRKNGVQIREAHAY